MSYSPLRMRPCYKEYLWGGRYLIEYYRKKNAPPKLAESWELAVHREGCSLVDNGPLEGKELSELDRKEFWGRECREKDFPVLVKLIDANKDLSIQVHPSDDNALREKDESGKAEMWYIMDCKPQAYIYYGFSRKIDRGEFIKRAQDGTICQVLNKVPVKKGDVFYILPGTIHAICAGVVIAEIQQNSNTTFRVYDYNRIDKDGKPRQLHLERAAEVMDYSPVVPEKCRANSTVVFPEFSIQEMFSCKYFSAYSCDVATEIELSCDGNSFQHLLCVDGEAQIVCKAGKERISRGESFFIPAALGDYKIIGNCRVLMTRV